MTFLLGVVRIQEPGFPDSATQAAVHCDAHPMTSVAPGQTVRIALTVQAGPGIGHAYGYLAEDSFAGAADVVAVQGAEYSSLLRHYRSRAESGGSESAVLTLRIRQDSTEHVLRPAVSAAIPGRDPRRLLRTEPLADLGVRIRGFSAPGRALNVSEHAAYAPALVDVRDGLPQGTVVVGHSQPRSGQVTVTHDGVLAFQAAPGAVGYDHFQYAVQSPSGERAEGRVVIHIGDLSETPGLLTPPGFNGAGTTAHAPWTQPKIHGPLPWPHEGAALPG
ncbi:Ig-like domain-containing protein [Streptomyces sp. NBC_00440]|uniref:Ig-like domain-containing protein n=1 Tax=unclassified Streptomyces TaxID=2593676 RepID=UPI002E205928|nr:Ig-like domain-containing protein [Streptomyces sp. NBC_00932]